MFATVTSTGGQPASIFQPLPGTPASRPNSTVFDSAAAQAASFSTPSSVIGAVVVRAQMASSRTACAWTAAADRHAAATSNNMVMRFTVGTSRVSATLT